MQSNDTGIVKIALALIGVLIASIGFAQELDANLRSVNFNELHAAAWNNDPGKITELVAGGMSVSSASDSGTTPLHSAAMKGSVEAARTLISLGANLEARDKFGRTPLFVAAEVNPHPKAVLELLLKSGASSTAVDKFGKTPLGAAWTDEARDTLSAFQQQTVRPSR